jgi:GntR family transcriptional regulator, transcriptional repressor for pyruvate dehydrogenase complex
MEDLVHSASSLAFAPVQAGRAFDDISAQIRAAMAAGALKPGARLPAERALAAQFGVSRNTLREALRSLENSGVLQLRRGAHAGAYVRESTGQGVATGLLDMYKLGGLTPEQLTEARILVESAIVRAACANCTEADIAALQANLADAVKLDKEGRQEERAQANIEFHRLVARATRNPLLVTLMGAILDVMQAFVSSLGPYEPSPIFASRRRFIALLRARDAEGAVAEMEASLRRLQRRYLSRFQPLPVSAVASARRRS